MYPGSVWSVTSARKDFEVFFPLQKLGQLSASGTHYKTVAWVCTPHRLDVHCHNDTPDPSHRLLVPASRNKPGNRNPTENHQLEGNNEQSPELEPEGGGNCEEGGDREQKGWQENSRRKYEQEKDRQESQEEEQDKEWSQ